MQCNLQTSTMNLKSINTCRDGLLIVKKYCQYTILLSIQCPLSHWQCNIVLSGSRTGNIVANFSQYYSLVSPSQYAAQPLILVLNDCHKSWLNKWKQTECCEKLFSPLVIYFHLYFENVFFSLQITHKMCIFPKSCFFVLLCLLNKEF